MTEPTKEEIEEAAARWVNWIAAHTHFDVMVRTKVQLEEERSKMGWDRMPEDQKEFFRGAVKRHWEYHRQWPPQSEKK